MTAAGGARDGVQHLGGHAFTTDRHTASVDATAAESGSTDLFRGLEALKKFKGRVDVILADFEGSPGSSGQVGTQKISRASFSGSNVSFSAADGLYSQYHRVHERLTSLSRTLGRQIEAMGIAVHGADIGFDNLDDDMRRRFHAIQTQVGLEEQERRDGEREKNEQPRHDRRDRTTDGGWDS